MLFIKSYLAMMEMEACESFTNYHPEPRLQCSGNATESKVAEYNSTEPLLDISMICCKAQNHCNFGVFITTIQLNVSLKAIDVVGGD